MGKRTQLKLFWVFCFMVSVWAAGLDKTAFSAEPFAVVELFSSEGCSSCPPADWLLSEIRQRAQANNERIYPLSFQVDYWNYLGWNDPFSRAEYSRRQYAYAKNFKGSSVYTPQMVVNGKHVLVGSDRSKAYAVINQELRLKSSNDLMLNTLNSQAGQWEVEYTCQPKPDLDLHFALVENDLESKITAGENSGRTIRHVNIVRQLQTISPALPQGRVIFDLDNPPGSEHQYSIIAFVQEKNNRAILAATAIEFNVK